MKENILLSKTVLPIRSSSQMGQTGFGICFSDDTLPEKSELLHNFNDIVQAEPTEKIHRKNLLNLNIERHTESQSVIKSLQKGITRNDHAILNKLATHNKVNVNWIPGHKGYE